MLLRLTSAGGASRIHFCMESIYITKDRSKRENLYFWSMVLGATMLFDTEVSIVRHCCTMHERLPGHSRNIAVRHQQMILVHQMNHDDMITYSNI